ncbi:PAS domain S-box protein [Mucilaginibacter xinganensis]|nr:PAS domain S-box protein [Mucilaginibacter xinganensis]
MNELKTKINELSFEAIEDTGAMLAYWDRNLICRFANKAYIDWFGKKPEEIVDKLRMPELLGELFQKNLPYIQGVLAGKTQTFERAIRVPSGQVRNSIATYSPDFENGKVKGFFVHVADITKLKSLNRSELNGSKHNGNNLLPVQKNIENVAETLKSQVFDNFPGIVNLSKQHFISESTLKREFAAKYNTSLFSYYRDLQMELAEKYLSEKKYSRKQIAAMFNFSNPSNFSACYKRFIENKAQNNLNREIQKSIDESYKIFISQAPFAIAMLDKELRYIAVSNKWITDYHLSEEYLIGGCHEQIFAKLNLNLKKVYTSSLNGAINNGDEELIKKADGTVAWMKWDIRPWYNYKNEIGGLLIFTEDISAIKQKELENQKISEILNKTKEIARIGAWSRDYVNKTVTWSRITKEILEVSEEFEPFFNFFFNFHSEGPKHNFVQKTFNRALKKGIPFDIEAELITAKGNLKRVRVIGYPELSNGVCTKISGIFLEVPKK